MLSFKGKSKKKESNDRDLQNPKILEVNLIKDEAEVFFNWNKNLLTLTIILFLASLFIMEIYLGLDWWEKQEIARAQVLTESISKVNQETAKLKNQAGVALAYKDKSAAFGELLENHVYWTNFFIWLEKNTLSSVKYDGFTGDLTGFYFLNAQAKSFADVSWQVKAFGNDALTLDTEVDLAQTGEGEDKTKAGDVGFTLQLQVKPEIFKK